MDCVLVPREQAGTMNVPCQPTRRRHHSLDTHTRTGDSACASDANGSGLDVAQTSLASMSYVEVLALCEEARLALVRMGEPGMASRRCTSQERVRLGFLCPLAGSSPRLRLPRHGCVRYSATRPLSVVLAGTSRQVATAGAVDALVHPLPLGRSDQRVLPRNSRRLLT